jgi:hypothetical protein
MLRTSAVSLIAHDRFSQLQTVASNVFSAQIAAIPRASVTIGGADPLGSAQSSKQAWPTFLLNLTQEMIVRGAWNDQTSNFLHSRLVFCTAEKFGRLFLEFGQAAVV